MLLRAGHNQIYVHQFLGYHAIRGYETKIWGMFTVRWDNFRGWDAPFMETAIQTKGSIWRKSRGDIMDLTCFSKGFQSNTFRDIVVKGFNWKFTKSHSCSWAIQHKSPLNIHYNNFEHTTKYIHMQRLQIKSTNQALRPSPKSRHFADDIFIYIKISFIKHCVF